MDIKHLAYISLILTFWALIFFVVMPRACTVDIDNQDALNAKYAMNEGVIYE